MIFRRPFFALALFPVLILAAALPARAETVMAVFYPDGAEITEELSPTPSQEGGISRLTLTLPAQADPPTLDVDLETEAQVRDITWERTDETYLGRAGNLWKDLEAARQELARLQGESDSVAARMQYWKSGDFFRTASVKEAKALSRTMGEELNLLHRRSNELKKEIEKASGRVSDLERELAAAWGKDPAWSVEITLTGPHQGALPLQASYFLRGSGWRPTTSFNAHPKEGTIDFAYEAEVWQATGSDLDSAQIILSTMRTRGPSTPPSLPNWNIAPVEDRPRPMPKNARVTLMAKDMAESAQAAPAPPVYETGATFGRWNLGKRSIPVGERLRLAVETSTWKAGFRWLVRPSVSRDAFLEAVVELDEALDLPRAPALFLVDGNLLDKRSLGLAGRKHTFHFGTDPKVLAEETLKDRKSGESGFIGKKRTFHWAYEIKVANQKDFAVPVRVEEPRPVVRDERIELEVEASSEPREEEMAWVWSFDLAPGAEKTLTYEVTASAPKEMEVDPGRR